MATGKPQLLFVHGIGGLRDTATDRDRWLQALAAGARDAGMVDAISGLTQGGWRMSRSPTTATCSTAGEPRAIQPGNSTSMKSPSGLAP